MNIKLDENLGSRGAAILQAAGHHVTTVAEEGLEIWPLEFFLEALWDNGL